MKIRFGPAGLGHVDKAVETLERYSEIGFKACEIAFTYGIYIKDLKDAEKIKKASEKFDIKLSIHAPYWLNLNSKEKVKVEQSKKRILDCCKIGEKLGAYKVVFHPGFYSGIDEEISYQNIKKCILDMQKEIKKKKYKIKLAPEIMGKVNVFGSPEQISRLSKETNCSFCIDFAHILAREKKVDYDKIKKLFPGKDWHCHFSGIEYTEKGEKHHKKTPVNLWKEVLKNLPKDKKVVMINESPDMINDSIEGLRWSKKV